MKQANGNYIRPTARYSWWLRNRPYFAYMMRELSSLFVGVFTLLIIWGLYCLGQGAESFQAWTAGLWSKLLILNVIVFIFAVYHSFTWFMVTPKAMPIKFKGQRIPGWVIIAAHMVLWLCCSLVVLLLIIYGGAV